MTAAASPPHPPLMSPKAASQVSGKPMALVSPAVVPATNPPVTIAFMLSNAQNPNPPYVWVEGSTNLVDWEVLTNFVAFVGAYQWTDTNGLPWKFYRVRTVGSTLIVTNLKAQ